MMNNNQAIEWLMENGGPVIRYRTATELCDSSKNIDDLILDLFSVKKVNQLLESLDYYGPISVVDIRSFNRIHSGAGVEGIVAKLLELGLKSEMSLFDKRMQVFRQYVCNELVDKALSSPSGQDVSYNRTIFTAALLASYFMKGGYRYNEIINFVSNRINLLYKIASQKVFDIYLSNNELINYPKRHKRWLTIPVVRPEYDPGGIEMPLPLIHDIISLAYFPKDLMDKELEKKINCIIEYILDERFQSLHPGFGLVWYKNNKTFYRMGWNPGLPCLHNFDSEYEKGILVLYLELMSHFNLAQESKWFKNGLAYMEQFRTQDGTYSFPPNLLKEKKNNGFVCGYSMGLEENRRYQKAFEIESTFRILLIKKRLNLL